MRSDIASMEKEQREIKANRKEILRPPYTERKYSQQEAAGRAKWLSDDLRTFYAAYGLLRGKRFHQIENESKPLERGYNPANGQLSGLYVRSEYEGCHPLALYEEAINGILEKYGYKFEYEKEEEPQTQSSTGKLYKSRGHEKAVCVGEQKA